VNKFSFLCFVRTRKEKEKRKHAVWVENYLGKQRDFWMLQFFADVRLSESQSDHVNYVRIDIEMFEELFSLVETKSLPCTTSYIIISDHKLN